MDISEPRVSLCGNRVNRGYARRDWIWRRLLLAEKFNTSDERSWAGHCFCQGLASTIPIALHVFGKKEASAAQH